MPKRSYKSVSSYTTALRITQSEPSIPISVLFLFLFIAISSLLFIDGVRFLSTLYIPVRIPSPASAISKTLMFLGELAVPTANADSGTDKKFAPLTTNGRVILAGPRDQKKVALTFDGDMTFAMKSAVESGQVASHFDRKLFEVLSEKQTKATLFLSGLFIELYPEETRELARNPLFELGNHSYSHPSFHGTCYGLPSTPYSEDEEIAKTEKLLKEVAGVQNHFFRFPGGCYAEEDVDKVEKQGLRVVHWDVVADDGFNDNKQAIIDKVVKNVQNGSIIVMHMNGFPNEPQTAAAMPEIIDQVRKKGFEFVTMSELLIQNSPIAVNIKDYLILGNSI